MPEASPCTHCAYTLAHLSTRICIHAYIHRATHRHVLPCTVPLAGSEAPPTLLSISFRKGLALVDKICILAKEEGAGRVGQLVLRYLINSLLKALHMGRGAEAERDLTASRPLAETLHWKPTAHPYPHAECWHQQILSQTLGRCGRPCDPPGHAETL